MRLRLLATIAALAALPVLAACALNPVRWPGLLGGNRSRITQEDLRAEVESVGARFIVSLNATADQIGTASTERDIRRNALLWKLRVLPLIESALGFPEPRQSHLALLTIATSQHRYLATGEGRNVFGALQPIAVAEAEEREEDVRQSAALFLAPVELERVVAEVDALVARHPMRGVFQAENVVSGFTQAESAGTFRWVFSVPMAPFRALEGVDQGARAIHEFNRTARRFSDLLARLPEVVRWQLELALYDLEDRETVTTGRESFATLAASSERLSLVAETLPADLRAQTELLLADARTSLADVSTTLERASALSADLSGLVERTERAAEAWRLMVAEARGPEPEAGQEPSRPFDVLDYERTAARIEGAAGELRSLVVELRALGESPGLAASTQALGSTVEDARGAGRELVNLATRRALTLLGVFFVALFVYRRIETRLARRG